MNERREGRGGKRKTTGGMVHFLTKEKGSITKEDNKEPKLPRLE